MSTLNATSINKKLRIKNVSVEKDWRVLKRITYRYVFVGESLFTFFASLAYVPLFLLELQNRLF